MSPSQNALVLSLAYSPDGGLLAVPLNNGGVGPWNATTRKRVGTLPEPGGSYADDAAFSPDGRTLATSDTDGNAYLWRVR